MVNLSLAPPGAMEDLRQAIGRVTDASGIPFLFDGRTSELPSQERGAQVPARYGDGFAPVLIAWIVPGRTDLPSGNAFQDYVGMANPVRAQVNRETTIVSGWVAVRTDRILGMGFQSSYSDGVVLMHELGHIVGLGHSSSPSEVMYEGGSPATAVTDWGPGDLTGLDALGPSAACSS